MLLHGCQLEKSAVNMWQRLVSVKEDRKNFIANLLTADRLVSAVTVHPRIDLACDIMSVTGLVIYGSLN